jgi:hypothetical protein
MPRYGKHKWHLEEDMSSMMIGYVVAGIVVLVLLGVIGFLLYQRQRTRQLQERFGPEYDRTVATAGDSRRGEAELAAREKRVQELDTRPLTLEEQDRFSASWQDIQARFVDEPGTAIGDADALIQEVMRARGYPVGDFEERAADLSVDHSNVVTNYRSAHRVALRHAEGQASTEELRQALMSYRTLFAELLGTEPAHEPAATTHREEVTNYGREEHQDFRGNRRGR